MTDKPILQLWLEALRSGNYRQGRNYLRTEKGFCCLGVLCDIESPERWTPVPFLISTRYEYGGDQTNPPDYLIEHIGLCEEDAEILIRMNDVEGRTFREIADYIETLDLQPTK